jgi:antitoxin component YwqK of YwqJK toxin-antitoxin module
MELYYVKFDEKNPSKSSVESIVGNPIQKNMEIYKDDELNQMNEMYSHYYIDNIKCYKTKSQAENILDNYLIEKNILLSRTGTITLYHMNGVKDKVYFHNNGKKEGDEIYYTEANTIYSVTKYIDGIDINCTTYRDYENNNVACIGQYINNKYTETEYFEDEKTISSVSTYNKEKLQEKNIFYDRNKNITIVNQYCGDYELTFNNHKKIYYLRYKGKLIDESSSYKLLLLRNNILLFFNFSEL